MNKRLDILLGKLDLTDEQKEKLQDLHRMAIRKSIKSAFKTLGLYAGACLVITLINGFWVRSSTFGLVAGAISGIFIGLSWIGSDKEIQEFIGQETKKILKL